MYPSGFANRPDTATLTAGQNTVKRNPDGEIMSRGKLLYAQSGGVTAVINATACAVIETARMAKLPVLAARNGILGALREDLIDTTSESRAAIAALRHTPGGAFGSCRHKLKSPEHDPAPYRRLIDVFRAHDIRWFLYNGGNDSADTAHKLSKIAAGFDYPLACIGVPKTVDNDLAHLLSLGRRLRVRRRRRDRSVHG